MKPQFLYGGDAFRCSFYVVLLIGSMREIWSYWRALSQAAVLEERQRIACELHDGVAQELAYLARNLESLDGEADEDGLDRLRRAVERARLESRRVISAAAAPSGQPFEVALAEAATEIAERYHVELDLDLTCDIRLPAPRRDAFVRIACEAVANAARHSGADRVDLGLERDGSGVRLWVSDKGHGFDPADPGGGFGLTSMRERAHSVGAELVVSSVPGQRQPGGGRAVNTKRRPLRVLIADDHAPSREDIQRALERKSGSACALRWRMPPEPSRPRYGGDRMSACSTSGCQATAWLRHGRSPPGCLRRRSSCLPSRMTRPTCSPRCALEPTDTC